MNRLSFLVAALLLAAQAHAYTFPQDLDVEFTRTFPAGYIHVGYSAPIRAEFISSESVSITGFFYSEQFPYWVEVTPIRVTLAGAPIGFTYESESDAVLPGYLAHRWILDDPGNANQRSPIGAGEVLAIDYTIRSFTPGTTQANIDGWFAMLDDASEPLVINGWDDSSPILRFLITTDAEAAPLPARLAPAFPNPFNPSTTLRFESDAARDLRLSVVDVSGRHVRLLAEGRFDAGSHGVIWDGHDDDGRALPTGLYFARLTGQGVEPQTTKLVLLK